MSIIARSIIEDIDHVSSAPVDIRQDVLRVALWDSFEYLYNALRHHDMTYPELGIIETSVDMTGTVMRRCIHIHQLCEIEYITNNGRCVRTGMTMWVEESHITMKLGVLKTLFELIENN